VQGIRNFRQVRTAESVIPYVLLVVCIALDVDCLEGVSAHPYIVWGDMVIWIS
jgi:hypothetical protein